LRDRISEIESKPDQERTEEEQTIYSQYESRRQRKNDRSRERALEKKEEIDRILAKPEKKRTKIEKLRSEKMKVIGFVVNVSRNLGCLLKVLVSSRELVLVVLFHPNINNKFVRMLAIIRTCHPCHHCQRCHTIIILPVGLVRLEWYQWDTQVQGRVNSAGLVMPQRQAMAHLEEKEGNPYPICHLKVRMLLLDQPGKATTREWNRGETLMVPWAFPLVGMDPEVMENQRIHQEQRVTCRMSTCSLMKMTTEVIAASVNNLAKKTISDPCMKVNFLLSVLHMKELVPRFSILLAKETFCYQIWCLCGQFDGRDAKTKRRVFIYG
jgi:hypothetical protein